MSEHPLDKIAELLVLADQRRALGHIGDEMGIDTRSPEDEDRRAFCRLEFALDRKYFDLFYAIADALAGVLPR